MAAVNSWECGGVSDKMVGTATSVFVVCNSGDFRYDDDVPFSVCSVYVVRVG